MQHARSVSTLLLAVLASSVCGACAEESMPYADLAAATGRNNPKPETEDAGAGGLPVAASEPPTRINGFDLPEPIRGQLRNYARIVAEEVPDLPLHAVELGLAAWWALLQGVPADPGAARNFERCTVDGAVVDVPLLGSCTEQTWVVGPNASDPHWFFPNSLTEGVARVHTQADESTALRRALAHAGVGETSRAYAHAVGRSTNVSTRFLLRDVALSALLQGELVRSWCLQVSDAANTCLEPSATDALHKALAGTPDNLANSVRVLTDFILAQRFDVSPVPLQKSKPPPPRIGCAGREDGAYCGWALGEAAAPESIQNCAAGAQTPVRNCSDEETCAPAANGTVRCVDR